MLRRGPWSWSWSWPKRLWLVPLVPLWALGVWGKGALLRAGVLRVRRLQWPVISVGSLAAGGAGKTPVVMALAALLARERFQVDVLSRGYGRGSGVVEQVDPAGDARRFGDEPLEMARAGLKVFVGADRFQAGSCAEDGLGAVRGMHVLDDGFQHRRLGRDVDVVLVTAEDIRDALLPAGNLREGLRALGRADVIVVREEELAEVLPVIHRFAGKRIWAVRRELNLPASVPQRPVVFCGIARPAGFAAMLQAGGVKASGMHVFGDHHAYEPEDFELLADAGAHAGADGFITTGKDAVKISATGRAALEQVGPIVVAGLQVVLVDEDQVRDDLRRMLRETGREKIGG